MSEIKVQSKDLMQNVILNVDKYLEYLDHPIEDSDYIKNLSFEEMVYIIENMLFDDDVATALKSMLAQIKKLKYNILSEDVPDRNMEIFEKSVLPRFNDIINTCFEAYKYGFTVGNMNSQIENGLYVLKEVYPLPSKYFRFNPERELYVTEELAMGQKVIPMSAIIDVKTYPAGYKFFVHRHGNNKNNPYGWPEVILAYYAWSMKNLDHQQWILFLKKLAIPSIMALFDAGESQEVVDQRATALSEALMAVKSGSGGAMANIRELKVIEPQASAHESFSKMSDIMGKKINKLLTGSFLHSDVATTGAHNVSTIHQETMQDNALAIAQEIEDTINNHIIPAFVALNNGDMNNLPKINFYIKNKAGWDQIRDSLNAGIPLKKDVLVEDFYIPIADEDEDEENIIQIIDEPQPQTLSNKHEEFFFQKKMQKNSLTK